LSFFKYMSVCEREDTDCESGRNKSLYGRSARTIVTMANIYSVIKSCLCTLYVPCYAPIPHIVNPYLNQSQKVCSKLDLDRVEATAKKHANPIKIKLRTGL